MRIDVSTGLRQALQRLLFPGRRFSRKNEKQKSNNHSPDCCRYDLQSLNLQDRSGTDLFWQEILTGLEPARPDARVFLCQDDMMDDPAAAIAAGHPFEACLSSSGGRKAFSLVLTGFPAVCIDKTDPDEIVLKEVHQGRIRYIPLSRAEREEEILCSFHVRGNVSSTLDKRPYKVSLLDRASGKYKTSLGGLREDDDWILNPLYTDSSRVREMTAYALWDQVTALSDVPQATSRMRYVELFLDNSYQGIYGLMEPVDGKQLALPGRGSFVQDRPMGQRVPLS